MIARRNRNQGVSGDRGAWLAVLLAALAVGCGPSEGDARLGRVLRDYVAAQDGFRADRGRYAGHADSLEGRLTIPRGVRLRVRWSGPSGHAAYAWSDDVPNRYCTVLALARADSLSGDAGAPTCVTTDGRPPSTTAEAARADSLAEARRGVQSTIYFVLYLFVLCVGLYPGGVVLERLGRVAPWSRWLVFVAPAAIVTLRFAYVASRIPSISFAGGDAAGGGEGEAAVWLLGGFWLAVVVHLGLFLTPGSLSRPSRRRVRWVSRLLVLGALPYAVGVALMASDLVRTGRWGPQADFELLALMTVGIGLIALHVLGLLQLRRAGRGTRDPGT